MQQRASRKLAESLREHMVRHNWQVLGFTLLTTGTSILLWAILYGGVYWLLLLVRTSASVTDWVPVRSYTLVFGAVAGALLFAAWFDRTVAGSERVPDHRPMAEIFLDLVLAVPRTTLAIWGNLSAWQWLDREELDYAAALVERVVREKDVPLHSTPLDIPDDRTRERVVFALLMLRVLDIRREKNETHLRLSPLRPETLRLPNQRELQEWR